MPSFDFLKRQKTQQNKRDGGQTVHKYPTDFLLGDLLVKSGVITQSQLDEAMRLAGNKHMQVGQMLTMAGYLSPSCLQAAVDAQSALRDRIIDQAKAPRYLKIACKMGMTVSLGRSLALWRIFTVQLVEQFAQVLAVPGAEFLRANQVRQ